MAMESATQKTGCVPVRQTTLVPRVTGSVMILLPAVEWELATKRMIVSVRVARLGLSDRAKRETVRTWRWLVALVTGYAQKTCLCNSGFLGCSCELMCNCSGNGTCNEDGSCTCDRSYPGDSCFTQDPIEYCDAASGSTKSGYPCLPSLTETLGYGLQAVTGKRTIPLVNLRYSQGKTARIGRINFEIPDNVSCRTITNIWSSATTYETSNALRQSFSAEAGLTAEYKAAYFSASAEYKNVVSQGFASNRVVYSSGFIHGEYECSLLVTSSRAPDLSVDAIQQVASLTGNRRVETIGTHYIKRAEFGGKVTMYNFVDRCVFGEMSLSTVGKEVEGGVDTVFASGGINGDVASVDESSCTVYSENSYYYKSVRGGRCETLVLSGSGNEKTDLAAWIASLKEDSAGVIKTEVNPIHYLFEDMSADVESYIDSTAVNERAVDLATQNETCPVLTCASPLSSESNSHNILYYVILPITAVVVFGMAILVYCRYCQGEVKSL